METVPKGVYARVPEAIAVADGDGILRWAAAAFVELTGTRLEALIGASCRALLHPEDEDLFERIAASPTQGAVHGTLRLRSADGDFLSVRMQPFTPKAPTHALYWALVPTVEVSSDGADAPITVHLAPAPATPAVLDTSPWFDLVAGPCCCLDHGGTIVRANAAFADMLGQPPESLIGSPFLSYTAPSDREATAVALNQSEAAPTTLLHRFGRVEKGYRVLSWRFCTRDGVCCASAVDQTGTHAAHRRFRALFDSSVQFVGLLRPDGCVVEVNRTALGFAGLAPHLVHGRPLWEWEGWRGEGIRDQLRAAVEDGAQGACSRFEMSIRDMGGGTVPIDFSITPVFDGDDVRLLVAEGRDISQRVAAERALRHRARELEAARREAEAASLAKSNFLANVSHQIRTPLNGILGLGAVLLSDKLVRPDHRRFVQAICDCGNQLQSTIDRVIDLAKIESGRVRLTPVACNLNDLIQHVLEQCTPLVGDRPVALTFEVESSLPKRVLVDAERLEQVLFHLVHNAVKFTHEGLVHVRVMPAQGEGEAALLFFEVFDTGVGMDADMQAQVFEPFFTSEKAEEAAGLGLAVARSLVGVMGGDLRLSSTPGRGSTFSFALPLAEAVRGYTITPIKTDVLAGKRVLLVDGDAAALRANTSQLIALGMAVDVVERGYDVIKRLHEAAPYDVVLLDANLADISGFELAELITASDRRGVPPLVLTHTTPVQPHDGFSASLAKPFDPAVVQATLREVLDTATPADPDARIPSGRVIRVLAADDNAVNRLVLERSLDQPDIQLRTFDNGRSLMEALQKDGADLLLMDIMMPGMDGVTAFQEMKTRLGDACPPVIALTANALKGDRERYLDAGMDGYLAKPFNPEVLLRTVRHWASPSHA